jgi:hypothetical protein
VADSRLTIPAGNGPIISGGGDPYVCILGPIRQKEGKEVKKY